MGCGGSKPEEPEETFPVPEPEKKPLTISEETAAINAKIKEAAAKKASEGGEEKTDEPFQRKFDGFKRLENRDRHKVKRHVGHGHSAHTSKSEVEAIREYARKKAAKAAAAAAAAAHKVEHALHLDHPDGVQREKTRHSHVGFHVPHLPSSPGKLVRQMTHALHLDGSFSRGSRQSRGSRLSRSLTRSFTRRKRPTRTTSNDDDADLAAPAPAPVGDDGVGIASVAAPVPAEVLAA